jgi:hypothetical protein
MDAGQSSSAAASGSQPPPPAGIRGGIEDFLRGINTGIAGDIVGAGQLARHMLPDQMTDPIAGSAFGRRLSEMANAPTPGVSGFLGNIAGAGLPFIVQPELGIGAAARSVPFIGKLLKPLWDIFRSGTLPAALQPTSPQTAQKPGEFWKEKATQAGIGTALGTAGKLADIPLQKWAGQRAANKAYNATRDAAQQARDAAQDKAVKTGRVNQLIDRRNQALIGQYRQAQGTRAQQTYQDRVTSQTAQRARDAIPAIETLRWWREALTPTGDQALAPTAVTPEASAQVRKIVGDRLTNVRQQMLVNPNDVGFRNEIAGIREQVHDQLSNQAMRDQWAFEPERQFDSQGNPKAPSKGDVTRQQNSVWGKFVEQPLAELQYLSGRELSDYSSRLGDLAEQYARRAATAPQAERPELEAISQGLRQVVDVIDRHGTSDPALLKQLTDAKRGYHLWSIGNRATTVEKGGEMTPGSIAREWARRQGDAAYGAEMIQGHPQYHPENARLKQGLERARQAHETTPPAAPPQPPLRPPAQWRNIPLPKLPKMPPERTPDERMPSIVGHGLGHVVTALSGSPTAGRVAREVVRYGGRGIGRPVLGGVRAAGTPVAAAVGGKIPEIIVTAKRPRPEERLP